MARLSSLMIIGRKDVLLLGDYIQTELHKPHFFNHFSYDPDSKAFFVRGRPYVKMFCESMIEILTSLKGKFPEQEISHDIEVIRKLKKGQ